MNSDASASGIMHLCLQRAVENKNTKYVIYFKLSRLSS